MIAFDGNNVYHRLYHRFTTASDADLFPAIFGAFVQVIDECMTKFGDDDVFITFDGGRSVMRTAIYPEYKIHRDRDPNVVQKSYVFGELRPSLIRAFLSMGIPTVCIQGYEGDDVIAALAKTEDSLTIVSTDHDYHQLICDNVKCFDPINGMIWTRRTFEERYGYPPEQYIFAKAMQGDQSDGIPGIGGWGKKGTEDLFLKYGSWEAIQSEVIPRSKKECHLFSAEAAEIMARNIRLMDLSVPDEHVVRYLQNFFIHFKRHRFPDSLAKTVLSECNFYHSIDDAIQLKNRITGKCGKLL